MLKKILPFLVAFGIFFSLFYLLSQPPKSTNNNNQKSAETTPPSAGTTENNKDIYKDYPIYDNPDLVFFWGNGCPHCENVEKWLDQNNTDKKIKINYKEVYNNKNNQTDLYNTAKQYCPEIIENGGIGVPTGFDPVAKKCIQGDVPIIEFLTSKLAK